jgi:hypothetical protein
LISRGLISHGLINERIRTDNSEILTVTP